MKELNESFNELIGKAFTAQLEKAGFKKRSLNWTRSTEDFFSLINIQRSQYNSHEELRFFINVGLHPVGFDNPPKETSPQVFEFWANLRCNDLLPNTPGEFGIYDDTDITDLTVELAEVVRLLIEKLNEITSVERLVENAFWRRPTDAARTYYAIGQDELVLVELRKLVDEFGHLAEFTMPALIERLRFDRLTNY